MAHIKQLFISMLSGTSPCCLRIDARLTEEKISAIQNPVFDHHVKVDEGTSEEEKLIPEPNSFPEANNHGIVPLEQLENDFHEEFSSRVSAEYAWVPGAMDFLNSTPVV